MSSPPSPVLLAADRLFRIAGGCAIGALILTAGALAADREWWRTPFVAAHLAALVALLPLGIMLAVDAARRADSVAALLRRHRGTVLLLAVIVVTVAVSLANFEGGSRIARRVANLTTVAIVLLLIVRYLRAAPALLARGPAPISNGRGRAGDRPAR